MNNPTPLLQVTNLRVTAAKREVVKGISFSLAPREVLAVVGESGSGKTLAMRSLIKLLPSGISSLADSLIFDGQDLQQLSQEQLRNLRGAGIGVSGADDFPEPGDDNRPSA